jgi:acetyl-CoA C-acetyltransferase
MRDVSIVGIGQTKVDEHWEISLRKLAFEALEAAVTDAGVTRADALYVGNMLSGELNRQEHLGALIADFAGLRGIETMKIAAACASGAAALRVGYLSIASGATDLVIVLGIEKMTDEWGMDVTSALALAADGPYEAGKGLSLVGINALLMQRYLYECNLGHTDLAGFSVNAHENAMNNRNARFHRRITLEQFAQAPMIVEPINLLDSSPVADGAAAVVLAPTKMTRALSASPVRIAASTVATDALALHSRRDPLVLEGAKLSAHRAYEEAGIHKRDIDLFELHDAFTIMAALSLEAAGFAERGTGFRLALEGEISIDGSIPIATMGGLKARGHPVGATGIYQIVEVVQQLRGLAGSNQVPNARVGMAQNLGGSGATAVTHILEV